MIDLRGNSIYLRLVEIEDAEFICNLRNNNDLNSFISKSTNNVVEQIEWIKQYKFRERNKEEFYFIICKKSDDQPIGTVRLYDFLTDISSFCWGSWILNDNKTPSAALESALLVYKMGFDELNFKASHFDVRKGNDKVHSFHIKMGAKKIKENDLDIYYTLSKEDQKEHCKKYIKFLEG